jgi:hypothetical protein
MQFIQREGLEGKQPFKRLVCSTVAKRSTEKHNPPIYWAGHALLKNKNKKISISFLIIS